MKERITTESSVQVQRRISNFRKLRYTPFLDSRNIRVFDPNHNTTSTRKLTERILIQKKDDKADSYYVNIYQGFDDNQNSVVKISLNDSYGDLPEEDRAVIRGIASTFCDPSKQPVIIDYSEADPWVWDEFQNFIIDLYKQHSNSFELSLRALNSWSMPDYDGP